MKKLFSILAILVFAFSFAQTSAGTTFVGVSSNSITGLNYSTVKDSKVSNFQAGLQGGHFFKDKLAVVGGLGYQVVRYDGTTIAEGLSYQAGAKYYVANVIPVQVDFNGVDKTNFIGTQLGYAWFPSSNFSIEPNVRYDFALKDTYKDRFNFGVGFNYFFE